MDQMEQTIFGPWRFGDPTPEPATANDKRQTTNDQAQASAGMESMGPKWQRRIRWVARQLRAWDEVPLAEQLEWIVEDVQDWGMRMCDRYEREIELMRQARAGHEGPRHPAVDSGDSGLQVALRDHQERLLILDHKVLEARQWLREIYEAATGTAYSDNMCWTEAMPSLVKTVAELKGVADLTKRYHELKQQYDEQHVYSRRNSGWLRQLYTAAMGQRFPELATWDNEFPRLLARIEELVLSERRTTNDQANDERQATNDGEANDERQATNDGEANDERQATNDGEANDPRSDAQLAFDMGNVPRLKTITTEQYVQAVRMRSEGKPLPAIAWQLDLPLRWFSAIRLPMITEHARQRGLLRTEHDLGRWDKALARRLDLRRREQ